MSKKDRIKSLQRAIKAAKDFANALLDAEENMQEWADNPNSPNESMWWHSDIEELREETLRAKTTLEEILTRVEK